MESNRNGINSRNYWRMIDVAGEENFDAWENAEMNGATMRNANVHMLNERVTDPRWIKANDGEGYAISGDALKIEE